MEEIDLLACMLETEIKTLEYKIQLARKAGSKEKIKKYKSEKAGLKRALGFINKIQDMEE